MARSAAKCRSSRFACAEAQDIEQQRVVGDVGVHASLAQGVERFLVRLELLHHRLGRELRQDRGPRPNRRDREQRRFSRDERSAEGEERSDEAPRMNGRDDSLPLDVLPPAIGADEDGEEASAPRPRRRSRGQRPPEGEDEIAPAA